MKALILVSMALIGAAAAAKSPCGKDRVVEGILLKLRLDPGVADAVIASPKPNSDNYTLVRVIAREQEFINYLVDAEKRGIDVSLCTRNEDIVGYPQY